MTGDEATLIVIDSLEQLGIPYMLVGSFSSNFWGVPRATQDADFVIQLADRSIGKLADLLGEGFKFDNQMSFEMVTGTTRYNIELKGSAFHIELFILSTDSHDLERFSRRLKVNIHDHQVYIPTAEDVLITKIRWSKQGGRAKDIEDAMNVAQVQRDQINWQYVDRWCREHGTCERLEELKSSVGLT